MSECTHNCSTCGQDCASRTEESLLAQLNPKSKVRKVYAVVSGKGGVGKSTVTSMLAVAMQNRGFRAAILDADITGPSIPKAFALDSTDAYEDGLLAPAVTRTGIQVMSLNLLLEDETAPVAWRGPVLAGAVKQFWTDVYWDNVDYMFVDMPPGTGDVPLTVFQSLPIDGIILVTTPQDLVSMIVAKAVEMAKLMNLPILGIVENYAWLTCPDCGRKIPVFGEGHGEAVAKKHGMPFLGSVPMDQKLTEACDKGVIELFEGTWLDEAAQGILGTLQKK